MPDDPVTLYSAQDDYKPPEGSRAFIKTDDGYKECTPEAFPYQTVYYVGCLRWDCANIGIDRIGFWQEPGYIEFVPSPLLLTLITQEPVIVNDLGCKKEATGLAREAYEIQKGKLINNSSNE